MAEQSKFGYIKKTINNFIDDDATTMAAALAYYTTFSLPPLLLIVITVAGLAFGREAVEGSVHGQAQGLIGKEAADQVQTMIRSAAQNTSAGLIGAALGLLALVFGATTSFAQLQAALNRTWHVKPDPDSGGIRNFVTQRMLSFGMILGIGFLLLVSLAISAALAAFGGWLGGMLGDGVSAPLLVAINFVVSFAVVTLLFAAILKVLPDAQIEWRDVWIGAAITAALFTVGKTLIGIYLGNSGAANAYGAAGSLVIIVLWIYYSAIILLLGAEFTKVWTEAHGRAIEPSRGAVKVVQQNHEVREPEKLNPAA